MLMTDNPIICICGGGNLAHVVGGYLAAEKHSHVRLLTRRPSIWCPNGTPLLVTDGNGKEYLGRFEIITDDAQDAVTDADIVLLCLPGFAIADTLKQVAPFLSPNTMVGSIVSSTGFFPMAYSLLPPGTALFGFQRVPFIARIIEYGTKAALLGYKPSLTLATDNIPCPQILAELFAELFHIPVSLLDNYLEATLTNSNPILHPSRLFCLFGDNRSTYDTRPLFYEDWDNKSSDVLISCDKEFQQVLLALSIPEGRVPDILTYYDSTDAASLTHKLRSIEAFRGLLTPMVQIEGGRYKPDFQNRYFTEDIPFGLLLVKAYAVKAHVPTPTIDTILRWAETFLHKQYFSSTGTLSGCDLPNTIVPFVL